MSEDSEAEATLRFIQELIRPSVKQRWRAVYRLLRMDLRIWPHGAENQHDMATYLLFGKRELLWYRRVRRIMSDSDRLGDIKFRLAVWKWRRRVYVGGRSYIKFNGRWVPKGPRSEQVERTYHRIPEPKVR